MFIAHLRDIFAARRLAGHRLPALLLALVVTGGALFEAAPARAADHAVILMYHRFGESDVPSTNITLEQFRAHLRELTSGAYTVMAVPDIVRHLKQGEPLPDRTVGLTVDDAYLSVYTEAWPLLKQAGLPLTLFVSTDMVDGGGRGYLSWAQIRQLVAEGVTIGNHTAAHVHMAAAEPAVNRAEIERATQRFQDKLGITPELFAYPYGEASLETLKLVREMGFSAAFGQHSAVAWGGDNLFYLPRFTFNENYGDLERVRLAANALPLRSTDWTPSDMRADEANNPPAIGFTLEAGMTARGLACYASHQGKTRIEVLGPRIEVRLERPLPKGRTRINCTQPAGQGRWRWAGRQFVLPGAED